MGEWKKNKSWYSRSCKQIYTYMNLIVQFRLEWIRTLRDASVQVIRFINGEVVRADRGHGEPSNFSDAARQLYTLAIAVVLNLMVGMMMVLMMPRLCHYLIMSRCNATISREWLRTTHMFTLCCNMLLRCLGWFASTSTSAFLCEEWVGDGSHDFTAHFL